MKLTVPPDAPDYPTILHALEDVARRTPDRTALICEDRSLTFAQHKSAVAGFARRLQQMHADGERVAILMTNCLEMPLCILGAMAAKAYAAPMNPNYTDAELIPLLKDAAPKVIVTLPDFFPRISKAAEALDVRPQVIVVGQDGQTVDAWMADGAAGLPRPLPGPNDHAMMFFTGGTTGLPKGAEHRHRHIIAFCRLEAAFVPNLRYDAEVSLSVAPMFHIFGHHHGAIHPLYLGSTHVLVRQYKPQIVLDQLSKYRVTLFAGGPSTVYVGILACEGMKTADLSHLKVCLAGSSPFSEQLLTDWEKTTGCPITEGVGMSEGAPYANNLATKRKVLSVGVPPPETEVEVVDIDTGTRVMPLYESGEIRVRGPQMVESYRNRPEETARTMRNGWVYTGDVGYFDDEGFLFVVDRKKEMIISGGYNIYPREVDEALYAHPDTFEVATVAMKDSFRGEVPVAFVSLKPGRAVSPDALLEHCRQRLVDYKVPKRIELCEALPKTGAGKIDKLKLRGLRS